MLEENLLNCQANDPQLDYRFAQNCKIMCYICCIIIVAMMWCYSLK
jgi:hypothetical protein